MDMANTSLTTTIPTKGGFVDGAVVRVKMVNFMTYSAVEVCLGPRMNVIVGPNGTGKSTILCAICLGLGGKAGLIGRATAVCDYIKHGCEKASIEIELCNVVGPNYIIRREILKNNQSVWSVNGSQSSQKAVDDLMNKMNIQMTNLCQFLPQDRVADFVKMSPQELLENTEKAIGNQEMWESHMKLKKGHSKFQELESNFARLKNDLETEMQNKGRLEEHAKVYNEKGELLLRIQQLNAKKAWVEYEEAREQCLAAKARKEEKVSELQRVQESLNPLRTAVNEHQKLITAKSQNIEKMAHMYRQKDVIAEDLLKSIDNLKEKSNDVIHNYKDLKQLEEQRTGRTNTLKQQLHSLENQLNSCPADDGTLDLEMDKATKELQKATMKIDALQSSIGNINQQKRSTEGERESAAAEMKKINDTNNIRLENLRRRHNHAYEATLWLRNNRDKFRKAIHEPIMTVINVRDLNWAKYIESQIPFKDMVAFVCEDEDDLEIFMSTLRDKRNLKINVVMAPKQASNNFQPQLPISHVQKWGFYSYLREMIEAPDAVLGYLCAQLNFHEIPVGNEGTKNLVPRIVEESPFRKFYTADHQFSVTVSRYGNRDKSTRCSVLQPARLLNTNWEAHAAVIIKEKLESCSNRLIQLENEIKDLKQKERHYHETMEQLRNEKKDLMNKKNMKKNLMARIEQQKLRIKNNEEERVDLDVEKRKASSILRKINDEKLSLIVQHSELASEIVNLGMKRARFCCEHALAVQEKNKNEKELHEHNTTLTLLERDVSERKQELMRSKSVATQLFAKAQNLAGVSGRILPEALLNSFAQLPDDLRELESTVHHLQAQADCLMYTDECAIQNYEQWKIKVTALEEEIEKKKTELSSYQHDMDEVEQSWLPALLDLIRHISSRFSRYFKSLGCAGEVELYKGENQKDYAKYGMCIKVKFRSSEPLRELTTSYQSGGERSVATILYLLALQEFIKLPFCCVDEINQGMDSLNEQRVMQLMTEILCNENVSQYLLVTPKLLRTSEFGSHVKCHCVFNGTIARQQWNIAELLRKRRCVS